MDAIMSRAAHVSAQRALVGLVGLIVVVVDFVWLKYPYDNDLKGLGWLITQIPRARTRNPVEHDFRVRGRGEDRTLLFKPQP